jgi:hypothetical protein
LFERSDHPPDPRLAIAIQIVDAVQQQQDLRLRLVESVRETAAIGRRAFTRKPRVVNLDGLRRVPVGEQRQQPVRVRGRQPGIERHEHDRF